MKKEIEEMIGGFLSYLTFFIESEGWNWKTENGVFCVSKLPFFPDEKIDEDFARCLDYKSALLSYRKDILEEVIETANRIQKDWQGGEENKIYNQALIDLIRFLK